MPTPPVKTVPATTTPAKGAAAKAVSSRAAAVPTYASFDSVDPGTGAVLSSWPQHDAAAVEAAVLRGREAAQWWQAQGWAGRRAHLSAWKGQIARRIHELADLVHDENGKPHADAVLEISLAVDHIAWAAKNAPKVLGPQRISAGLLAANQAATLEYQPLGVVGVIGPWNYPVFTPMGSIAYALASGNAVVFKPSEHTPAIGAWLVDAWAQAVPAGKDAMIVTDDANVQAAADAALWGGMSNAGQTCIGIERVYVTEKVFEQFLSELTRRAKDLRPGSDAGASYGPITMPGQVDIIRDHIADALAKGGTAVTGGGIDGAYVEPTILIDVPEDSLAVREETFGPTLTVTRVKDAEEALRRTNATSYGLAGSVFTGSRRSGVELARRMRSGMTSVNSVIAFASVPGLPFGGVGESGFGRIHGADGLKEFTRAKSITSQRFALPVALLSFSRPAKVTDQLAKVIGLLHGRR